MVSFSVSPFEVLVDEASLKADTRPPRRFTAVSKLSLVRVEGSKNSVATTLPSRIFLVGIQLKMPGLCEQTQDLLFRQVAD